LIDTNKLSKFEPVKGAHSREGREPRELIDSIFALQLNMRQILSSFVQVVAKFKLLQL